MYHETQTDGLLELLALIALAVLLSGILLAYEKAAQRGYGLGEGLTAMGMILSTCFDQASHFICQQYRGYRELELSNPSLDSP